MKVAFVKMRTEMDQRLQTAAAKQMKDSEVRKSFILNDIIYSHELPLTLKFFVFNIVNSAFTCNRSKKNSLLRERRRWSCVKRI